MPPAKVKAIPKLVTVGKHTVVSRALGGNWKLVYDPQLERHYPPAYLAEPEVRQAVKEKRGKVYRVDGVCPGVVRYLSFDCGLPQPRLCFSLPQRFCERRLRKWYRLIHAFSGQISAWVWRLRCLSLRIRYLLLSRFDVVRTT
jgi:hypothetical protein